LSLISLGKPFEEIDEYLLDPADIELFISIFPSMKPQETLNYMLKIPLFNQIYNHDKLSSKEKWERNSISLSVYRFMKNNKNYDVGEAIDYILNKRNNFENKEIIGSNTYLITFIHEGFSGLKNFKDFGEERGANVIEEDLEGIEDKEAIKQAIIDSKERGKTTIWIFVHGLPKYICLKGGIPTQSMYGDESSCNGFRYNEFSDILLERGNLEEIILIIDSCYSYNFAEHLLDDLDIKIAILILLLLQQQIKIDIVMEVLF